MPLEACLDALDLYPQIIAIKGRSLSRSFPVPVFGQNGEHFFAVLYFAKTGLPPDAPKIWPPQYRLVFACNDLKIVGWEAFSPANRPLGEHNLPPGLTMSSYLQMKSRLFSLYDQLGGHLWSGRQAEQADIWCEAGWIWSQITEQPLQGWYQSLNHGFFAALHAP